LHHHLVVLVPDCGAPAYAVGVFANITKYEWAAHPYPFMESIIVASLIAIAFTR
jgi:hypothetical protein